MVAIDHEPNHRLMLSTDTFRVFDVSFPPGAVSLWHLHDKDSVLLCLEGADVPSEEPGTPLQPRPPIPTGEIYYRPYAQKPFVHRISNRSKSQFRILDIEVLAATRPNRPALDELSDAWRIVLDNDRVRVSRLVLNAQSVAPPTLPASTALFVTMTDGAYAIKTSDQPEQKMEVRRGDLRVVDEGDLELVRNLAESAFELIVVEVK